MSEPSSKRPRITPRNSIVGAVPDVQTPFQDLHQLGKLLRKPTTTPQSANRININTAGQRAYSSGNRTTPRGTPGTNRTPILRSVPRRRGPPTTPHAIRAQQVRLNQRNAGANTPGRDRRRSGRFMRDTPRDDLRQLSRALAVQSKRLPSSSPRTGGPKRRKSRASSFMEQDVSPALDPPRLSLGRREMADDDDSFHEAPPRMSVPLDEYDVEGGRREWRRDRESFGNLGLNDFHDVVADIIDETEDDDEESDLGDIGVDDDLSNLAPGDNETTRNLRALMEADRRDSAENVDLRHSIGGNTDGEPTFQFRIADRSRLSNIAGENADRTEQEVELPTFMDNQQDEIASQASSDYDAAIGQQLEADQTMAIPNSSPAPEPIVELRSKRPSITVQKKLHRSRFGIEYPSLQPAVVKKLAATFSKSYGGNGKINKETLTALTEASDWFFEQASEDLVAYADHARRKRIEESDVITLMKRQRQLNDHNTVFSVAQKFLPGELLQNVRMAPVPLMKGKKRRLETVEEEEE